MTPQAVRERWRLGLYTPKGYLYDLLKALRVEGRIEIFGRATEFCQAWEIGDRTFRRAKAELIADGLIEETSSQRWIKVSMEGEQ